MSVAALSPAGALAWLASLSVDLRATAVLDAAGGCLAGDAELGRRAAACLEAAGAGAKEARDADLIAVRSDRHVVAAALGPKALERVTRADLWAALAALDGR